MNKQLSLKKGSLVRIQNMRKFASSEGGRILQTEELNTLVKLDGQTGVIQGFGELNTYLVLCNNALMAVSAAHLAPLAAQSESSAGNVLKVADYCTHSQERHNNYF